MKRYLLQWAFGLTTLGLFVLAGAAETQTKADEIDLLLTRYHEQGLFNGAVGPAPPISASR